ncbi:MAG: chemotaxis protein CheA [bacterium]|nr:chemotaxis protein CheA [bacterium]
MFKDAYCIFLAYYKKSIEMKEFQQKFIDDTIELMNELEHNLLTFEKNPRDKNLIESIFRTMHTLKGSGGMFGYSSIVELTHKVEDLYAKIQNEEIEASEKIINVSFSVSDIIRKLLHDVNLEDEKLKKKYDKLIDELDEFKVIDSEVQAQDESVNKFNFVYITMEPDKDFEERGVQLKTIFQDLSELGEIKIIPKPNSQKGKHHLYWEVFLSTEVDIDTVEQELMFISSESEMYVLSDRNFLQNRKFIEIISKNASNKSLYTNEELKEIVENIIEEEQQDSDNQNKQALPDITRQGKATLRVDAEKLDELMKQVSDLITLKSGLKLMAQQKADDDLYEIYENLDKITSNIRDEVFELRLIPLESIRVNLERLIRDTAIALNKEIQFTSEGLNTELDKTIVDKMLTPLLHVIRNSIDHGIETTNVRAERDKTSHGNIHIKAYQSGSYVYIRASDDGGGIDKKLLIRKALAKNIIKSDEKLTEKETFNLIFAPGLSTAVNLSEVSGRGVGMDAVKTEITKLRGSIYIESKPGMGTTTTFKLPSSLSILDTLLVKSGGMYFSVPLGDIDSCMLIDDEMLEDETNDYIRYEADFISYVRLRDLFKMEKEESIKERAVIINREEEKSAIIVDEILGEFQAVLKPLGDKMKARPFLLGGSLMSNGKIAYIIDTGILIKHYN